MSLTKATYSLINGAPLNVVDFGAVGNGTGDLGAALQAAHDALGPDGGQIRIPAGASYYRLTTTVNFTKPVSLTGDGWYNTEIYVDTAGLICILSVSKLDVENISWTAAGAASGTCTFIQHANPSANHGHSTIRNNFFADARYSYRSLNTNAVVIDNNVIGCGANGAGLYLENQINSDIGDSFITNNTISGDATSIGILVPSTSGLNICNNKFNSFLLHHVLISVGANLTGNFLLSNNSFEGHTDSAIKLIATTGTVTKTIITGNQFSSENVNHITVSNNAKNTVITGNTFNSTTAANGVGISIESGASELTITGNAFHQILNGIVCAVGSSVSAGITASGNRFANDVRTFFVGDDGLSTYAPQREIGYSEFVSNSSDTVYQDVCKIQGAGTFEVRVYGVVQGVGDCNFYAEYLLSDATPATITAPVTSGAAFDVQVATALGFCVVSVKRATAVGSSLTAYVDVIARGQISEFSKA